MDTASLAEFVLRSPGNHVSEADAITPEVAGMRLFGSLITTARLPVTPRPYHELEEYCTRCGACVRNCPGGAISLDRGKEHPPCYDFQASILERTAPRYGCGKCQVAVPCMSGIPGRRS